MHRRAVPSHCLGKHASGHLLPRQTTLFPATTGCLLLCSCHPVHLPRQYSPTAKSCQPQAAAYRHTPGFHAAQLHVPRAPSTSTASLSASTTQQVAAEEQRQAPTVDAVLHTRGGTWRLRPYHPPDFDAVVQLQTDSFHDPQPIGFLNDMAYRAFRAEVVDCMKKKFMFGSPERFQMIVAEEVGPSMGSGCVVGVVEVSLHFESDVLAKLPRETEVYGYLASMAVSKDHRRRGVASALIQAAVQQCILWSQPNLFLHVYEDNPAALAAYGANGFKVLDKDPSWKAVLGGRVRFLMYKDLHLLVQQHLETVAQQKEGIEAESFVLA